MSEDNSSAIPSEAIHVEIGRSTERAIIVAWLRTHQGDHARVFAGAIEAGEHWEEMEL